MASDFSVSVSENFDLEAMTDQLVQQYQAKGFKVRTIKMKNGVKITFDKKSGGINMVLGMGLRISATCTMLGKEKDTLSVNFGDGDWTGKIVGCIVGWFLCFIPVITAIIGICKQLSLPNDIADDIQMLIAGEE